MVQLSEATTDHAQEQKNLSVNSISYPKTHCNYFIPQNNKYQLPLMIFYNKGLPMRSLILSKDKRT